MNYLPTLRSYLLIACMSSLPACLGQRSATPAKAPDTLLDEKSPAPEKSSPWITVWIHGTHPSFESLPSKRLRERVQDYAHQFFYCKPGIHHWSTQPETNRHCRFAELLNTSDPLRFPLEHFHTFGWSGDLNFQARHEAGEKLYHDLVELIKQYNQTHSTQPYIRLITHSHGGNVALNLALAEQKHTKNLIIDELVLLACPVQVKTASLTQDPLFKRVYSFYSSLDLLQIGDPQGLYRSNKLDAPVFSQRRFPTHAKVAQAKIRCDGRAIMHIEFLSDRFVQALPNLVARLDCWHQETSTDTRLKQIHIHTHAKKPTHFTCSYARRQLFDHA